MRQSNNRKVCMNEYLGTVLRQLMIEVQRRAEDGTLCSPNEVVTALTEILTSPIGQEFLELLKARRQFVPFSRLGYDKWVIDCDGPARLHSHYDPDLCCVPKNDVPMRYSISIEELVQNTPRPRTMIMHFLRSIDYVYKKSIG